MKASDKAHVTVLIPAHNEQDVIADAIGGIYSQSVAADRLVIVADNCTDRTTEIASGLGAEVFETESNRDMKAGALNQALGRLGIPDDGYVLIVDADTVLSERWIESALDAFAKRRVGAVGGIFIGDGKNGSLGDVQGLEYYRYAKEIHRTRGEARVLTGTSTMFPIRVAREIEQARARGDLPGRGVYNVDALTEDFELTIAIKRLGYRTVSPSSCTVVTETMPDISSLWRQRVRWQRGAIDVLLMHGLSRITLPYWLRQIETALGIVANVAIWTLVALMLVSGSPHWSIAWACVGAIFYMERMHSAVGGGKRGFVIAATMFGDIAYDMFISVVWVWCLVLAARRTGRTWGRESIDTVQTV